MSAELELYEQQKADRWTMAKAFANSELCPKHFRGKTADIAVVMSQAETLGCDWQAALANMFVVHGTAGYASKFLIALANRHGVFDGPIRYRTEGRGKDAVVTAWAKLHDGSTVESIPVDWAMAQAAGWTKNPKYREIPELMFRYRSAAFLVRTTCPEAVMGMLSIEEIEDVHYADKEPRDVTPRPDSAVALVQHMIDGPGEEEQGEEPEEPREVEPEEDDIDTRIMRGDDIPDGELFGGTEAPQEDPA